MKKRSKLALVWDGGIESALSLFELKCPEFDVTKLICLVEGTPSCLVGAPIDLSLLRSQAGSLELPLEEVVVEGDPTLALESAILKLKSEGIEAIAFGFTKQEDLKKRWEAFLKKNKLKASFPLWSWDIKKVLQATTGLNYRALCVAVRRGLLLESFLGRAFEPKFVSDLPKGVDPLHPQGEFWTYVLSGLFFESTIGLKSQEKSQNDEFQFLKLSLSQVMN